LSTTISIAREKQVLLECILKDPKHTWLKHMDGPQTFRACVQLYLGKFSLTRKSRPRV
jgi:hypothetical protein